MPGTIRGRIARSALGAICVVTYAWWAVSLPPFSGLATAVVLASGAVAGGAGVLRRRPASPPREPVRAGPWAAMAGVLASWQIAAYVQHPRVDHPTLSSLTNELLDSRPARAAAFVLWLVAAEEIARR